MTESTSLTEKTNLSLELFIVSATSLFFELLVIRWFGCDFISFAVFKTFPLVACFIGLGVGIAKADSRLFRFAPLSLLLFAVIVKGMTFIGFGDNSFPAAGLFQWANFSSTYGAQLGLYIFGMMLAIPLILAGPFAVMLCIGSRIGYLFNRQKPLRAYCLDIAGAITGSIIFSVLSFLWLSPSVQLCIVAALILLFTHKYSQPRWLSAVTLIAAAAIGLIPIGANGEVIWTPYYKIEVAKVVVPAKYLTTGGEGLKELGILMQVNHGFSQAFSPNNDLSMTPEAKKLPILKTLEGFFQERYRYYNIPHKLASPKEILILGAGTGSDIDIAVKHGVESITGIEIDPGIISLGKRYNQSYTSPKVHIHNGDGRDFINKCAKKFDMIIFACLDSASLSGVGSSVRTDSYIHTMESYRRCLSLLKPDGLLIVSFGASVNGNSDWLRDRIDGTLTAAGGYRPLFLTDEFAPIKWPAYIFISGNPVRDGKLVPPSDPQGFSQMKISPNVSNVKILTDDWPYLYVRPINFDVPYLLVLLEVILITLWAGRQFLFSKQNSPTDWQLLFMGAAFMLLELQMIARLSLAYGATWMTASVVINGILIMILAANLVILKCGIFKRQEILYAVLILTLVLNYFLPVNTMLSWGSEGISGGHIIVTFLSLLPMFIAGLIFASAFAKVKTPARSFAFNLIGSVLGALLEYISTYTGVKSLILATTLLYAISLYFYFRVKPDIKPDIQPDIEPLDKALV
jgi:hypothetical protein